MFDVEFAKPVAGRSFAKLPRSVQRSFDTAFYRLARDPRAPGPGLDIHQLSGYQNLWTLRISVWRGIYAIDGQTIVMIVFGHRETIYPLLHHLLPPEGRYIASKPASKQGRN